MKKHNHPGLLIGIDIGGTFTDFVIHDNTTGKIITSKVLSTPADPSQAVISGLRELLDEMKLSNPSPALTITHGSTVATNALLERKGARTALVTTSGFRDIIEIGRQNRLNLYDLMLQPREMLIKKSWRYEIGERVDYKGDVIKAIDRDELQDLVTKIRAEPIESVAVCLLFSFLHPQHEQQIAHALRDSGMYVSLSSQVLPEFREYERTSTTVLNAYVTPIIHDYLGLLESSLSGLGESFHLRIMQSNGGIISVDEARQNGVRCIVSGPAGGVVGASHIGHAAIDLKGEDENQIGQEEHLKLITFDMGGTSTDVSLVDQKPVVSTESIVGGFPIGIPMLDVHTIGAGGGSIARVDLGGALRVGPESTGADPGPACYALGNPGEDLPTVTDANVVLGRLLTDHFLGGKMQLDRERAFAALQELGAGLGLDAVQTALGVIDVINAHMERALRLVTIERGHDPQEFFLVSFGGAGGLHAAALAKRLSIPEIIVPPLASTLSAYGMLVADVIKDYSLTVMLPGNTNKVDLDQVFQPMYVKAHADLRSEGIHENRSRLEPSLDMRYAGQSFELKIPYTENFLDEFHRAYERNYGYAMPGTEAEIVNIRLQATGLSSPPELLEYPGGNGDPTKSFIGSRPVIIDQRSEDTPVYKAELLVPGDQIEGPAIILRKDTTVFLPGESNMVVDQYLNQVIRFN